MIYPLRLLKSLPAAYQVELIISDPAKKIMEDETGWNCDRQSAADFLSEKYGQDQKLKNIRLWTDDNFYAGPASGSYFTEGMVVCPCSMKTLSGIANGYAQTLIERAADVNLKERRPLILLIRETPFNRIHLENMLKAHDAGAVIVPANPAFYHYPETIEDLVDFIIARILNLLKIEQNLFTGWQEEID